MAKKEFRIAHGLLQDPNTITEINRREFLKHGFDMRVEECDLTEDFDTQERVYSVQPRRKYFFQGGK